MPSFKPILLKDISLNFMMFKKSTYFTVIISFFICLLTHSLHAQADNVKINIGSGMGSKGSKVCIDFTTENFDLVESFQFSLSYNSNLILPECPPFFTNPALSANGFDFIFECSKKDIGFVNVIGVGDAISIPDGAVLFTVCFDLIGNPGNKSPININGQFISGGIEVCIANSGCNNTVISNEGQIMITTSTLEVFFNKCDADFNNPASGGSIKFYATGGTPPYSYTVNPGGFTGTNLSDAQRILLPNLPLGLYTLNVTDNIGNSIAPKIISVSDNFPLKIDASIVKNPSCADRNNGYISISSVSGGITPYNFEWSNLIGGINVDSIGQLSINKYSVTITDNEGCQILKDFELAVDTLKMGVQITKNATCDQSNVRDGSISITASGGSPFVIGQPYEYSLNGGNFVRFTPPFTISNFRAGSFTILVRDTLNCDADVQTFIMPANKKIDMTFEKEDISCFGLVDGRIILTASPYSVDYTFQPLAGFPNLGTVKSDTFTISNMIAANYAYRVIDADGCRDTVFFTIVEPAAITLSDVVVEPACSTPGSITVNPQGGTGPYDYLWDPPAQNANTIINLSGGLYNLTVSDQNECTATYNKNLTIQEALTLTPKIVNPITCLGQNDARLSVEVLGPIANGPYTFEWTNTSGVVVGIGQILINAAPDTYTIKVTDKNGCFSIASIIVLDGPALDVNSIITNAPCNGGNGRISLSHAGNPTGYVYEWTLKGSSTIIDNDNVLDAKAGDYEVTIKTPSNCNRKFDYSITEPAAITFDPPLTTKVSCFGGDNGAARVDNTLPTDQLIWSENGIGNLAVNLKAGNYWVILRRNGCFSDTVKFEIFSNPKLEIDDSKTAVINPTCFGDKNGSVTIASKGGTGLGYKYAWDTAGAIGPTLSAIGAGSYIVTLSDNNNCEQKDTFILTQPTKLEATLDNNQTVLLNCNNTNNGKIALVTTGGNPGKKTISWQTGVTDENGIAIGLSAGTYCATISDNFGCRDTFCYTLSAPEPLIAELNVPEAPLCFGDETCISVKSISGGTGNKYTFQINNGFRYPIDSCVNVFAGQYFINFFDSTGCSIRATLNIDQPDPVSISLGEDKEILLGSPGVIINADISTAFPIDTAFWSPNEYLDCLSSDCSSVSFQPIETQNYILTVVDQNGCSGSDEISITVKDVRNVYFANIFTPNGDSFNDYFQAVTGEGVEQVVLFTIYDRWGNLVFEKSNYIPDPAGTDGWDGRLQGKPLDPGVFVYYAKVRFIDQKLIEYSGSVTLADKVKN